MFFACKAARRIQKPRPVYFFVRPVQWIKIAPYLGGLYARHTSSRIEDTKLKDWAWCGPLLNRRGGLPVVNGVLLYKRLLRPTMDYVCSMWRSAARSHVWKQQELQSKCLRIATNASWHITHRQIHRDLGIPFFADQIRALTESLCSKSAAMGNLLFRQLVRHLCQRRAAEVTRGNRGGLRLCWPWFLVCTTTDRWQLMAYRKSVKRT